MDDATVKSGVVTRLKVPLTPNFIQTEDGRTLPIASLSDDDLRAVGAAWTVHLLDKANRRRLAVPDEGGDA